VGCIGAGGRAGVFNRGTGGTNRGAVHPAHAAERLQVGTGEWVGGGLGGRIVWDDCGGRTDAGGGVPGAAAGVDGDGGWIIPAVPGREHLPQPAAGSGWRSPQGWQTGRGLPVDTPADIEQPDHDLLVHRAVRGAERDLGFHGERVPAGGGCVQRIGIVVADTERGSEHLPEAVQPGGDGVGQPDRGCCDPGVCGGDAVAGAESFDGAGVTAGYKMLQFCKKSRGVVLGTNVCVSNKVEQITNKYNMCKQ
jgi:hypothetical protein